MAIYNNLNSVRKLSSSSLTSIVDVTNLNFKSIADANLEFLSKIKYDEVLNSISINRGTFTYVDITDRLTFSINGVPTFTIDSLGRAEGQELLVKVSETKRQRFTDFPDWPDEGVPGEIIYTGIQNQRPEFGEDFIGYLDGRGWVSLTTLNSSVGYLGLTPVQGSPAVPPTVPPGDTVVWVGAPGLEDMYIPADLTVYFTDAEGNTFDIITDPVWEYIEGSPDSAKFKPLGTMIVGDLTNNGSIRYVDGNQQAGYVLTSDAFGNASWQPSTGGGGGGGTNAAYVEIVDLVANTSKTITHSLNSADIHVQLIDLDTNELIEAQVDNYTLNTVDIVSSADNNNVKVVILAAGGAPPGTLAGLTDVYLMSPLADGDILVYDSITGTWFNSPNTGGGGADVLAGDGIDVTPVGSFKEISINLDPSQTNLEINGSGELTFAGVHVKDEGTPVGTYKTINFIGVDVLAQDSGTPGQVNVYIPTPTFASHFNTNDGTTTGTVSEGTITRSTVRISTPTTEGNPFKTNGWAGTNRPSYTSANGLVTFATAQQITGFSGSASGDATITVTMYDASGIVLETYTTPTLYQNGVHTSLSGDIIVTVSLYATDTSKFKGRVSISVVAGDILSTAGYSGGRYYVVATMDTDTATDGGGTYTYTQPDVFFDTNGTTPAINGSMTIAESSTPSSILTKHLSGVEYYILGSRFEADVTDIDNFNQNTQGFNGGVSKNFTVTAADYGLTTRNITAWSPAYGSFPGWSNTWDQQNVDFEYLNWDISATNYRYRGAGANGTAQAFDPWNGGNLESSPNEKILIDTVTSSSTGLSEDFDDEDERLVRGGSSYSSWNSASTLSTSVTLTAPTPTTGCDACVVGDYLVRPDKYFLTDPNTSTLVGSDLPNYKPDKGGSNPNYSGSGYQTTSVYHRKFYTSGANLTKPISNFIMTFGGSFGTSGNATAALAASNMKIYIRRAAIPSGGTGTSGFSANPLALHGGLYNSGAPGSPYNDGASGVDTLGSLIRTGSSSGNTVTGTFGGDNALEGFWMELQIIDSSIKIDFIDVTLNFSDGSSDAG